MAFPTKPSSLSERRDFYSNEFKPEQEFVERIKSPVFAFDVGFDSGIFLRKHAQLFKKIVLISSAGWDGLKEKAIAYLPEDVYYDRNIYYDYSKCRCCDNRRGCPECENLALQELVFDIDVKRISCACRHHGSVFCVRCIDILKSKTLALYDRLSFKQKQIVFSGRGFHIHVFDKKAYKMCVSERTELVHQYADNMIDKDVSIGFIHLIRLPGSLHGLVSRKVVLLSAEKLEDFDPLNNSAIPFFLIRKRREGESGGRDSNPR